MAFFFFSYGAMGAHFATRLFSMVDSPHPHKLKANKKSIFWYLAFFLGALNILCILARIIPLTKKEDGPHAVMANWPHIYRNV